MSNPDSASDTLRSQWRLSPLILGILCGVAGFIGNWFYLEIFLNVSFLFGSFFVMFAILRYGLLSGTVAGILAGTCTYFVWNHPWAIIIVGAEALVTGYLTRRRGLMLLHANVIYWLVLGFPLVVLFYHGVMRLPLDSVFLIILKQAINGFLNALAASIIAPFVPSKRSEAVKLPFRHALFYALVSVTIFPSVLMLIIHTHRATDKQLSEGAEKASRWSRLAHDHIDRWANEQFWTVNALAQRVGVPGQTPPRLLQREAELVKSLSRPIERMGVFDADAIVRAYVPITDPFGHSMIGMDFSDRPYFQELRQRTTPMVTDVMLSKVGTHGPISVIVAPIIRDQKFRGFVSGVINQTELHKPLEHLSHGHNIDLTLLDRQGRVIISTRADRTVMSPLVRPSGGDYRATEVPDVKLWVPSIQRNISIMNRWRESLLVIEKPLHADTGWTLIAESSLLPLVRQMTDVVNRGLLSLAALIAVAVVISTLLARGFVQTINSLQAATGEVPDRIQSDDAIALPKSHFQELDGLIRNFGAMITALRAAFQRQRLLLEKDLRHIQEKELLIKDLHDGIGGIVANISMLSDFGSHSKDMDRHRAIFSQINDLSREGVTEVRSFMNAAGSNDAGWTDLLSEIKDYASRMLEPHGIRVNVTGSIADNTPSLGLYRYTNIVRIFRECVTNSLKHASAKTFSVSFIASPDAFTLRAHDDGIGFQADQVRKRGIANMHFRAQNIRAELTLEGRDGTTLHMRLPLGR
jgi:signal transduction histidine kinase